ncbi:MAG: PAS domain-containing sensor histidine kinase [Deltaproteobacteria bacterium]|nr:PAS domain-containing sensor histidine kinase [Deltaproteobacteria bacterium]
MKGEKKNEDHEDRPEKDFQNIAFYSFIIDSLPVGILTVNPEMKVTSLNRWAEKLTGYSEKEAVGRFCGDVLRGGMCKLDCPLKKAINRQHPVVRIDSTIRNRYGEIIPVRMNTAALLDDNGRLIGGVEAFQDISRLKTLEREKDNLISMFAHDMKSSLTVIGGFVLRLIKKARQLDEEKQRDYLNIIRRESGKLESLVNDFLEFSRLQAGRLKLNLSATSLDKELMELSDAYQLKASQSGLRLELKNEEELPVIICDSNKLRRVFSNLLDNAIKFSKDKGTITLSTHTTPDEVIVEVKDEGIGIDADELPYVFDSFHRGRGVEQKEGFGLGLASVKAIVEGHGGRIAVESEPGKGSVFSVFLPRTNKQKQLSLPEVEGIGVAG